MVFIQTSNLYKDPILNFTTPKNVKMLQDRGFVIVMFFFCVNDSIFLWSS